MSKIPQYKCFKIDQGTRSSYTRLQWPKPLDATATDLTGKRKAQKGQSHVLKKLWKKLIKMQMPCMWLQGLYDMLTWVPGWRMWCDSTGTVSQMKLPRLPFPTVQNKLATLNKVESKRVESKRPSWNYAEEAKSVPAHSLNTSLLITRLPDSTSNTTSTTLTVHWIQDCEQGPDATVKYAHKVPGKEKILWNIYYTATKISSYAMKLFYSTRNPQMVPILSFIHVILRLCELYCDIQQVVTKQLHTKSPQGPQHSYGHQTCC